MNYDPESLHEQMRSIYGDEPAAAQHTAAGQETVQQTLGDDAASTFAEKARNLGAGLKSTVAHAAQLGAHSSFAERVGSSVRNRRRAVIACGVAATAGLAGVVLSVTGGGGEEAAPAVETTLEETRSIFITETTAETTTTSTTSTSTVPPTTLAPTTTTTVAAEVRGLLRPAAENYEGLDCVNPFVIQADTWFDPIAQYCGAVAGFKPADVYEWNSGICDYNYIPIGTEIFFEPGHEVEVACPPQPTNYLDMNQNTESQSSGTNEKNKEDEECPTYYAYFTPSEGWDPHSYLVSQGMTPYRARLIEDQFVSDFDIANIIPNVPTSLPALPTLYCLYPFQEQ